MEELKEKIRFKTKIAAIFQLLRFSTCLDVTLLILGTLASIAHGVALPIAMHYFGFLTNAFINQFTSKQLANFEFSFKPRDFLTSERFRVIDLNLILSGFINFTNITGGVVNCSEDYVLLPPNTNFDEALQLGVTDLAECLDDETFIHRINQYVVGFVGIAIIVMIVGTIQIFTFQLASDRQAKTIKERFFRAILFQEAKWFDSKSSGELSSRLSNDIEKIRGGIGDNLAVLIQWLTTFIAGFVIGFIREWRLTLLLLGVTPFITITVVISSVIVLVLTSKEQAEYASASAVVEEALTSIHTVVAYGGENIESSRYNERLHEAKKTGNRRGIIVSLSLGIIYFLIFVCYSIGFWFSAWLLSQEIIQAGDVLTVFFAVLIGIFSLGQAVPNLENLVTAAGASVVVYNIIDQELPSSSTHKVGDSGYEPDHLDGSVEFVNVNFAYPIRPDRNVLNHFSLKVERGKTVALVGPSGSGKSTVIQLLMKFYDIDKGQLLLDGNDVRSLSTPWLRTKIGLVGQEPVLFDTTVEKNIGLGKEEVTRSEIIAAAKNANVHDFVFNGLPDGYETNVGKRGTQMSGGQKQRIAIARALVRQPQIMLLDDATSALDSESESIVQKTLDQAREGRTMIIVTHRLSTIMSADLIAYMDNGTVTELGTHNELMNVDGAYANLVTTQYAPLDSEVPSIEPDGELQLPRKNTVGRSNKGDIELDDVSTDVSDNRFLQDHSESKIDEVNVSWARVWKMNSREACLISFGILGSSLQGAIYPAFAYFFGQVLRVFTLPFNEVLANVHLWAGLFLVLGALSGISTFTKNICFFVSGSRLSLRLRSSMFKSILHQEIAWFDRKENAPAVLTTRLSSDAGQVQGATGVQFGTLIETVVSMFVAIIISLIVDQLLALVIIGFLPFLIAPSLVQLCILDTYASYYKRHNDQADKIALDSINNHRTVRALSVESKFLNTHYKRLNIAYKYSALTGLGYGITYAFSRGAIFLGYAITFRFGAYQSVQPINGPYFARFELIYTVFMALIFGSLALNQANGFSSNYAKAKHAAKRVFALLDRHSLIDSSSDTGEKLDNWSGEICLKNINFIYPTRPGVLVMSDMSLSAPSNKNTALVGPSGYGKSTVMSLLERFYDPLSGSIEMDGKELRMMNLDWLRSQIGIVFQEPVLFDRSIADNIAYGANFRKVSMEEVIQAANDANIHNFVESLPLGYQTIVGEGGTLLSRGQKQRISIARALLRNPKILLLDEATSSLDSESEREVQRVLDQALKNRTSIVIAHRLSTVCNADKIAVLKGGKVSEQGTHSELMERDNGLYRKMYQYQTKSKN